MFMPIMGQFVRPIYEGDQEQSPPGDAHISNAALHERIADPYSLARAHPIVNDIRTARFALNCCSSISKLINITVDYLSGIITEC